MKNYLNRIKNSKLLLCICALSIVSALFLLCFFKESVFAQSINNQSNTKNSNENFWECSNDRFLVCVKGGQNSLNLPACHNQFKNISNESSDYYVKDTLMKLDINSDLLGAIGNNSLELNNMIQPENLKLSKVNDNSEKCEIVLVEYNGLADFCTNIKKLDGVLWAQPDLIHYDKNTDKEAYHPDNGDDNSLNENFISPYIPDNKTNNNISENSDNSLYNDPYYPYQWYLSNNQDEGVDYSIDADKAWENGAGQAQQNQPIVGVIDTGVDYNHEDLDGRLWDKGNEYPDLVALGGGKYGINCTPANQGDSTNVMDDIGHGTVCSSIIAAQNNNNKGICGINGLNAKVITGKWEWRGYDTLSYAIRAYNYMITAKKCGVDLCCISNSWGVSSPFEITPPALNTIIVQAAQYGIYSLFANGNDGVDLDNYTNYNPISPYMLNIGASKEDGDAVFFSNYGKRITDIFAPGVGILAAITNCPDASAGLRYYSWLNKEDDSYFHENFNDPENCKINLSWDSQNNTVNNFYKATNDVKPKEAGYLSLDGCSVGDNISVNLTIDKKYLSELISSENTPYISYRYMFKDIKAKQLSHRLAYKDKDGVSQPLYRYRIEQLNRYYNPTSLKPITNEFLLDKGSETITLQIQFTVDEIGDNPAFCLNDFGFGKKTLSYRYEDGTSFSCPIIAAIASELCSHHKHDDPNDVLYLAAVINGSVKRSDAIKDKCVTGGVANFNNAYLATNGHAELLNPVIQFADYKFVDNKTKVTLKGYFFGAEKGTIKYNNTPIDATSWSDTEITFDISCNEECTGEFTITNKDGHYGSKTFYIPSQLKGYTELQPSNIVYKDKFGNDFTTKNLEITKTASTNNAFYVLYSDTYAHYPNILEKYDYNQKTWFNVDISSLSFAKEERSMTYSMTAADDELYLLYPTKVSDDVVMRLATFSERENKIIFDVSVDKTACLGDMIHVFNGELILAGRVYSEESNQKREFDAVKIYPDTGNVYGNLGNLPTEYYCSCGNMSSYDNKLYITDSFKTDTYQKDDYRPSAPCVYDGKEWSLCDDYIINPEYIEDQHFASSSLAVDSGLVSVGQIKKINFNNIIDTYLYNNAKDEWTPVEQVRYFPYKLLQINGTANNNIYYLISKVEYDQTIFRSLDLKTIGVNAQDVPAKPKKENFLNITANTSNKIQGLISCDNETPTNLIYKQYAKDVEYTIDKASCRLTISGSSEEHTYTGAPNIGYTVKEWTAYDAEGNIIKLEEHGKLDKDVVFTMSFTKSADYVVLSGRVVDSNNNPIDKANVSFVQYNTEGSTLSYSTKTNQDGSFSVLVKSWLAGDINISKEGYKDFNINISAEKLNSDCSLGTIILEAKHITPENDNDQLAKTFDETTFILYLYLFLSVLSVCLFWGRKTFIIGNKKIKK